MCCSELNVKASSSLPPGQTTCSSLSDRQGTCREIQVRDLLCLICPPVSTVFSPHMSISQHSWIFGHGFSDSLDQPIPNQILTFYCDLSCWAFLEIRITAECSSTAFLFFGDRPSSWPAKTDRHSWPFHQACCPGSLQCIVRRKSHYLLLTKKLFHNTESFERVSLYLCLQSRLKYVALHNLTRWQFASMYFFYFHCWILCTLCSEELGTEITNSERVTVKYWKKWGEKALMLCAYEGSVICLCRAAEFAGGPCPIARAAGVLVWIHAEKCGTLVLRTVIQVCRIQSRSVLWWFERSWKSRVCNGFFSC